MRTKTLLLLMVLFTSFLFGCGGTRNPSKPSTIYKKNLGHCLRNEFLEIVNKIVFVRNQYVDGGNMRDMSSQIEINTEWRPRSPFADEKALGIVAVESRIIVGAKSTGTTRSLTTGEMDYSAYFQAENRVQYAGSADWQQGPITREAKIYFGDIAEDMAQEFRSPY